MTEKTFEKLVWKFFKNNGVELAFQKKTPIGLLKKKEYAFDLGNENILVECKSDTWTEKDNVPSGIYNWCNTMYSFYLAPKKYKKFFVTEMSFSQTRCETLVEYFIEHYFYLIPTNVVFIDYFTNNFGYVGYYVYDKKDKRYYRYYSSEGELNLKKMFIDGVDGKIDYTSDEDSFNC